MELVIEPFSINIEWNPRIEPAFLEAEVLRVEPVPKRLVGRARREGEVGPESG